MEINNKSFVIKILVLTIGLFLSCFCLHYILPQLNLFHIGISLSFFFVVSLSLYFFMVDALLKKPKTFTQRLMISMVVKLFSSIIYVGILAYFNRDQIKIMAIWFLVMYLIYHMNLMVTMNVLNRKKG